jgi:hypothetical protein
MRVLLAFVGVSLLAQVPFVPTAELGKPVVIGEDVSDYGQIKVDYAKKFEVTLESAELALRFANRRETVLAGAGQKLVILRGTARNLSKEKAADFLGSMSFGVRVWKKYDGPGTFQFVMMTDPDNLRAENTQVPPGGVCRFVEVLSVPAGYEAMQLGLYFKSTKRLAWYDLRGARMAPAAPEGMLALDTLDVRVAGVERTREGYAVDLDVKNPMLLPSRWGWQYFTAELVGADGTTVRFYPGVEDRATGKAWVGDLAAGAGMTGRYSFTAGAGFVPRVLRLTSAATGRVVEVGLGR